MNYRDKRQIEAIKEIKHFHFGTIDHMGLLVAVTGAGKGHIIKLICEQLSDITILIIVPRVNLVTDLSQRTNGSIYCASLGKKEFSRVTVATKQSIKDLKADLLILDECHQYTEEFINRCKKSCSSILGMTATPYTEKGFIYPKLWKNPIFELSAKEAIDNKMLCGYQIQGSKHSYIIGNKKIRRDFTQSEVDEIINSQNSKIEKIVKEIILFINKYERKKVVLLCASIKHAEEINVHLNNLGHNGTIIHSKIKNAPQKIEQWKNNNNRIAISVLMLSEGFDCPAIDCVVFLRPTKSTRLAMQAIGRGLRLHFDKEYCLILDFAQVIDNCGTPVNPIYNFNDENKKSNTNSIPLRTCEECWYKFESKNQICPACGHDNTPKVDYNKNLISSLFDKSKSEPYFIFTANDFIKRGISKNNKVYGVLSRQGVICSLFGKQVNWFDNVAKRSTYVKVYIKKSGKWKNATKLEFSTKEEYLHFSNLSNLQLFAQYPELF